MTDVDVAAGAAEDTTIGAVFSEEDYENYEASIAVIIKKVWICLQATIMTQFMIRGIIYYTRVLNAWTKVQWLLLFQGF